MATPIPHNRAAFGLSELARITGAEVRLGNAQQVCGVTTDTRADLRGKLFVALTGERFDGHDFVGQAVRGGAAAVLVERDVEVSESVAVVRVSSTLDALGSLARAHRRRWGGKLVAVAGSAGKTTTRHAVGAVLRAGLGGAVHEVPGNLNNQIGVPMVLLGIEPQHRVAVVEIGTNQRGEVEKLSRVCEPDIAVLTLIALEHAAGIGDLDAVEAEEGDLLRSLGSAAVAIANGDDPRCRRQLQMSPARSHITYGSAPGADYQLVARSPKGLDAAEIRIERPGFVPAAAQLTIPHLGLPGALASVAAIAVGEQILGTALDLGAVERQLLQGGREAGRLCPIALSDGSVLLDDSYNANPGSVRSSVAVARELADDRRARLFLVLGDMLELGAWSRQAHEETAEAVAAVRPEELIAIGDDAACFVPAVRASGGRADLRTDARAAAELLLDRVRPGDVVLVKASRSIRADLVARALLDAKGGAA